jgi:phenylacetate-CoA ligase
MPSPGSEVLGPTPRDPAQRFWDPAMQQMDPEQRRALQLDRVRDLVGAALHRPVPLFARKLAEGGVGDARDIGELSDLDGIPVTVKEDLRRSEASSPPFGDYRFTDPRLCVRLGSSTGTTGTPTLTVWTRHDIWVEYESAARNWWRNGWRPGMIVTHAHPAYLYGGGVMLSGCLEYFGMLNLWVPPPDTDELAEQGIRMWQRVRPDVSMVAFSLGRFTEVAAAMGLDLAEDVGLPSFQFQGGGGKALPLFTAGLECYAYSGGPCTESPGAHLHEDWAVFQAVDPATGKEVSDGEWGSLVVTTLDRDNGLLRYDLEEACAIDRTPCPCGETTPRGFWGGRFKDLLSTQGRHVQLTEVEGALRAVEAVSRPTLEYVVVRPRDEAEPLRVRVELADGDPDEVAGRCRAAIAEAVGIEADVEVVARGTLPRSGYKATRLVSS